MAKLVVAEKQLIVSETMFDLWKVLLVSSLVFPGEGWIGSGVPKTNKAAQLR